MKKNVNIAIVGLGQIGGYLLNELKNKDTETGCTIHFVIEDVDAGPILVQKRCYIEPNDTAELLKKKVQALEGIAYIEAINLLTSNR